MSAFFARLRAWYRGDPLLPVPADGTDAVIDSIVERLDQLAAGASRTRDRAARLRRRP